MDRDGPRLSRLDTSEGTAERDRRASPFVAIGPARTRSDADAATSCPRFEVTGYAAVLYDRIGRCRQVNKRKHP